MGIEAVIRWLLPREDQFYTYLEGIAAEVEKCAVLLEEFGQSGRSVDAELQQQVQAHEHASDKWVHQLEEALAQTFVTPIDREDLQRIGVELDSVLDLANAAIRAAVLLGVEKPTPPMLALFGVIRRCVERVAAAVKLLRTRAYGELVAEARTLRAIEKEGDTVYRQAIKELFHDDTIDFRRLLREREVLDDLEGAVDACERVAQTLGAVAVKHG